MQTVMVKVKDLGNFSISEMQEHLENYANSLVLKNNSETNPVSRLFGCLENSTISLEEARNERLLKQ